MRERDYLRKRQEIEQKCQQDIAALDRVWAMFNNVPPPQQNTPTRRTLTARAAVITSPEVDSGDTTSKRDAVRAALRELSGREFMSKDVRETLDVVAHSISQTITENQLSSIVSRLASRGEIRVVRPKIGRSPAIYATQNQESEIKAS